ncbi:MAG: hypothetical protein E7566_05245 [Ruminococcaceae bacterium]|nr:hypothetical protein [Oscillospiraceae bacterium]
MGRIKQSLKNLKCFLFADDRKLGSRILLGAFAGFTFVLSFLLYNPIELYLNNSKHFSYSLGDILLPVLLTGLGAFLVILALSVLLRGRVYNWFVTLLASLSLASLVQILFMNKSVGLLDGTKVQWRHFATSAVVGLVIWALIIVAFFAILRFKKHIWKYAVSFACVLICVTQGTSLLSAALFSNLDSKSVIMATTEGNMELSDKHNVVVLSVDSMDMRYTKEVMKNNPEYFDEFDGFTWYQNTMTHYFRTYPNLAVIFTGEEGCYDKPYDEYMKDAWENNEFLEEIADAGYDSRVYIRSTYLNPDTEYLSRYVSNYKVIDKNVYSVELEKRLLELSAFRSAPVALKPFFETDTSEINGAIGSNNYELLDNDDSHFYKKLVDEGLSLNDKLGEKGTFTYFHFIGCHAPYRFDSNCISSTDANLTIRDATRGVLTNIAEYLRQMKEQGIYDSSDIIITTDHGYTGRETELTRERVVTLFHKPAGAKGDIEISNSPQQLWNIRPTVLKAMGVENYADYGTPFDEVAEDANIKRYFYMSGASEDGSTREHNLITYEVVGDANDFKNWKKIDTRPIKHPFLKG